MSEKELKSSPCINGGIYGDIPSEGSEDFLEQGHKFNGVSDYEECVIDVKKIFNRKKECRTGTDYCSFKNAFISDVKPSKFMVMYLNLLKII